MNKSRFPLDRLPPEIIICVSSYLAYSELLKLISALEPPLKYNITEPSSAENTEISPISNRSIMTEFIRQESHRRTLYVYGDQEVLPLHIVSKFSRIPRFHRTITLLLFGKYSSQIVFDALEVLGPILGVFFTTVMILFHGAPFLVVLFLCFTEDFRELMLRALITPYHAIMYQNMLSYESHLYHLHILPPVRFTAGLRRRLRLGQGTAPFFAEPLVLAPWSSHLYLITSLTPHIQTLHLESASLAGFFRVAGMPALCELCLEECELDVESLRTFSTAAPGIKKLAFVHCTLYPVGDGVSGLRSVQLRAKERRKWWREGNDEKEDVLFPNLYQLETHGCFRYFNAYVLTLLTAHQRAVRIKICQPEGISHSTVQLNGPLVQL